MANYPIVAATRMAYGIDGSVLFTSVGGSVTEYGQSTRTDLNDESTATAISVGSGAHSIGVVFPQLRDLAGFFVACSGSLGTVETSTNTTTGFDGTWSTQALSVTARPMFPYYRTSITYLSVPGIKAIRFNASGSINYYVLHLYGSITAGQGPASRLAFWHPTIDQALPGSWLDWGDDGRETTEIRSFRLRNLSSSQTANSVAVSVVAPTDTTNGTVGAHTFSLDGTTYTNTVTVSSISANSYSPVIYLQRTYSSVQFLGLFAFRVQTAVGSWT